MRSTFFGLEIGRKALQTQQRALDVTGHNIANANTQGYSRQQAVMTTTSPFAMPAFNRPIGAGQVGTGVMVQEIRRVRDSFIDMQVREEVNKSGEWAAKKNSLDKLEVVFNEPSDSGLRTVLDQFWESWQELAKKPELEAVRATVRQRGIAVTETFNHLDRQLTDLADDIDSSIKVKVDEINNIASQIATLNSQIVRIEVQGDQANDLRDKRDLLVDELSEIVEVSTQENQYGSLTVSVGGRALVMEYSAYQITTVPNGGPEGYVDLAWLSDGSLVSVGSGGIRGMMDTRDSIVPSYQTQLNAIANSFVSSVNAEHAAGFGLDGLSGRYFFDPDPTDFPTVPDAGNITIHPDILASLDNIAAASAAGAVGDGSNALDLAELKHSNVMGTSTVDDFYRGMVAQLGVQSQEATRMVNNQNLLVSQLENRRQEVSGVSLDEEMTNMIKFQHAYNAAARTVTAMDEMLDVIVNRLGMVGR